MDAIVLLVILAVLFGGVGPWWGYSHNWGWGTPVDVVIAILFIIILVRVLQGNRTLF